MLKIKNALFLLIFLLISVMVSAPDPALGSPSGELQSEIKARQEQLVRYQRSLDRLSRQEREAYSRLAGAEDRLDEITRTLESQEEKLADMLQRETEVAARLEDLSREKEQTREKLAGLLENIWPIFLESRGQGLTEINEWSDLDRKMTWIRSIYSQAEETHSLLQAQSRELIDGLDRLQVMRNEFQAGLDQVNKTKSTLLNEKLSFLRELQGIRAQRLADEEMVAEIIDIIESLNYQLTSEGPGDFESFKGRMIWPASGSLVSSFTPAADPPHNGLSMSLEENSPVKAVSWGKVMHNDTLRGFGRVVILYHGEDYYTLYAFLSQSSLQPGQEVERGETIGRAGYYPRINSHGVYFELRFRQKPINPVPWLEQL